MADNFSQHVDLGQLQAILASLPKQDTQLDSGPQQSQSAQQSYQPHQHVVYPHSTGSHVQYPPPADPRLAGRSTPQLRQTAPKQQDRASTPLIDPATITEWKQGLRCVSKVSAQNPDFVSTIRKLIQDQEQNVRSWEAGRQRLIEEHDFKRENERTHRAALSLPGLLEGTALLRTPEREKEELEQYDAKVYRASKAMVESQSSVLKVLGVPFFGVKPYLVVQSAEDLPDDDFVANASKKITKAQLLELQRKMLNHLNELYGD